MHCVKPPVLILVLGLLLPIHNLRAQTGSMRVTVPSPTAASLGKFGDVPVNLYTGIPDISIPLFTVKGRTLELPIVLRYHAGGIRVEEIAGWAGLGWTLDAGGAITRTVRGIVDERYNGYYHTGHVFYDGTNWKKPSATLIDQIRNDDIDGEPDRFFFSFAGRSGQFVMGPTSTSTSVKEYRTIPYQKIRIQPTFVDQDITKWAITTEDGTRYTFAAAETSIDYSVTRVDNTTPLTDNYNKVHTSSWNLTEIRAPGGDVIKLYYSSNLVHHRPTRYVEVFDQRDSSTEEECVPTKITVDNEYMTQVQVLDSIKSAAHTIVFNTTLRSDALSPSGTQQERRLDYISIRTPAGTELRRFQFVHDYFTGNRLRLKEVYEKDANSNRLPGYTFTYNNDPLPAPTSKSQDHWGFYNGKPNNSLIPGMVGRGGFWLGGADRSPDPAFMTAGMLTRITYPTGGYTEYEFEANDYGGIGSNGTVPIDESPQQTAILSSSEGEGFKTKTFTIGGTDTTIVEVDVAKVPICDIKQLNPPCPRAEIVELWEFDIGIDSVRLAPGTYTLKTWDMGAYVSIMVKWRERGPTKRKTAGGLRVAKITTADAMGNITVRKYQYTRQSDPARSSGVLNDEPAYGYFIESNICSYTSRSSMSKMPLGEGPIVGYSEVTVLHGADGEYGKTRHTFRSVLDVADQSLQALWPFSTRTSYEWKRGQPTGVTEHNASGQVQQRTSTRYEFRDDPPGDDPPEPVTTRRFRGMSLTMISTSSFGGAAAYQPFEVISAWVHPKTDSTFVYNESGSGSISTVKSYSYGNPVHAQLTEVRETNSDGTERITRMKYPADYATGTADAETAAITEMQGPAHMHSPVIERWVVEKKGSTETLLQGELTTFKIFAPGQILPFKRFILLPEVP